MIFCYFRGPVAHFGGAGAHSGGPGAHSGGPGAHSGSPGRHFKISGIIVILGGAPARITIPILN